MNELVRVLTQWKNESPEKERSWIIESLPHHEIVLHLESHIPGRKLCSRKFTTEKEVLNSTIDPLLIQADIAVRELMQRENWETVPEPKREKFVPRAVYSRHPTTPPLKRN